MSQIAVWGPCAGPATRREADLPSGIVEPKMVGARTRVGRAIHFARAAGANRRDDLVGAEPFAPCRGGHDLLNHDLQAPEDSVTRLREYRGPAVWPPPGAKGRARHRYVVDGGPWRMDFSRAGCSLISLSGRATSISFFLYVVESLRSGGWKVIGFPMAFGLRFWADEKPCLFSMLGFPIRFGLRWIGFLCGTVGARCEGG